METKNHSVQFAGGNLAGQRHICAFFNSIDEEHRVLRSFFKDGFDRGEKATHIVDPEKREEHLKRLAEAGINVRQAMDTGQLELRPWRGAFLRGDRFDHDSAGGLIVEIIQSGAAGGDALTRPGGHNVWGLLREPAEGKLW